MLHDTKRPLHSEKIKVRIPEYRIILKCLQMRVAQLPFLHNRLKYGKLAHIRRACTLLLELVERPRHTGIDP